MPETTNLTTRQQAVLAVIEDAVRRRGYPPTHREIGDAVGLASTSSVAHQLRLLERAGRLRRTGGRGRARAIELVPTAPVITADTAAHVLHAYGHPGKKAGTFTLALIEAIARADLPNRAALADSYPGYVAAVSLIEDTEDGGERLARIAGIPSSARLRPVACGEAV